MAKSWILYGPSRSGKSTNAKAIAKKLGMSKIIDGWEGDKRSFVPENTLHITNHMPDWVREENVVSVEELVHPN